MDFARGVKKHEFLQCFGPFGGHGFYLGDVQKLWFLRGFGLEGWQKNGKIGILKVFQHSWLEKNGQGSANIGPKMGQHGANIGQDRANIGQHRANMGPTWGQDRANIDQHRPNMGPR